MGWKIIVAVLALSGSAFAQNVENGERHGLLEVSGSIYPTYSFNAESVLNMVGGHVAYQFDEHYSFRGDAFVSTSTKRGQDFYNDWLLFQASFLRNFTRKRFDGFAGLGLGMSVVQMIDDPIYPNSEPHYAQPTVDGILGFKFHVNNYFYFYGEGHLFVMQHPQNTDVLGNLAVTGGLGLQLPCRNSK